MAFARNRVLERLVGSKTATATAGSLSLWIVNTETGTHGIFCVFDFGTL
jgi:hypothetical protein